jgi:hypothetical protein
MAEISREDAIQLDQDRAYMKQANMSQGDIDSYTQEFLSRKGYSGSSTLETGLTLPQAIQTGAAVTGAVSGAAGARSLFENKVLPYVEAMPFSKTGKIAKTFAPWLRIPVTAVGEGIGAGGLHYATQAATAPFTGQTPSLSQSADVGAQTAKYGALGELLPAALGQAGLASGGVSQEARAQMRARPAYQPTISARRAIPPDLELQIGDRLKALTESKNITPGRIATTDLLNSVEKSGARVDIRPTLDAFDQKIGELNQGLSPQESSAARVLQRMRDKLVQTHLQAGPAARGDVSPTQMDQIALSLRKVANFGKPGPTITESAARDVYRAHKNSLYDQLGGLGETAKATKTRLDAMEEMSNFISENKPQGAVASIGKGLLNPGDIQSQSAIRALDTLEGELGTGGKIKDAIRKAAMGRTLTAEERPFLGFWERLAERLAARPVGKFFMGAAKPVGSASAATAAFSSAMSQRPEQNP